MKHIKLVLDKLFSTSAAGLYMLLFAASIGLATFVENDFGTSSAQKIIFQAWWFELLLIFFGISLIANIIRFRMIQQKKWAILTFHAAMIIILLGAGITRYFGSEGMMHIREGSAANTFLSSETYLQFEMVHEGQQYRFDEPILFASLGKNKFESSYLIGQEELKVKVLDFMPNPTEKLVVAPDGRPILKVVMGGMNGREEYFVRLGDRTAINGTLFNFGRTEEVGAFNIKYENGQLLFKAPTTFTQMQMATQTQDTIPAGNYHPLLLRSLYASGNQRFVIGDFMEKAKLEVMSESEKMTSNSLGGVDLQVQFMGQDQRLLVYGSKGMEGRPRTASLGNSRIAIAYGAKAMPLPFSIALRDFIMERYPGTNSASSYASEVTLLDAGNNLEQDQRIYMNHILNYKGYRFFQSSFDQDELGTYLSVNHDAWGTRVSYLGYFLLTLGMILTLFSKKSRFQQIGASIKKLRVAETTLTILVLGILLAVPHTSFAAIPVNPQIPQVDIDHAQTFGQLLMQDYKGRLKPMNTFAGEILRKLSRKESLYGLSAEQIVLSMAAYPNDWYGIPLIKSGKHEEIRKILQSEEKLIAYKDFFLKSGEYKLKDYVRTAYNMQPRDRGAFEKELLKLDEKVNICSMVFSGRFMTVFPIPGDPNHKWQAPGGVHQQDAHAGNTYGDQFYPAYRAALQEAIASQNWGPANQLLVDLDRYQQEKGTAILPAPSKVKAEIWLNKLNIFSRLGKVYALLGLGFLGLLFTSVFKPNNKLKWPIRIAVGILAFSFLMHTLGLGLRWYVSGRAPWSNGYESMIYIGWTTILAGLIFARRSMGGLAATTILSATILMVAGLSWLDPEITPLVPVLKSYWLTIHVSLEAGSYGFLMLGAIIGVLNLILMILRNQRNELYVNRVVKEMTLISEMTLIGGLFMISIGTYLGGVWANESWGRYWGWDAKETWALVTILVYSFILHMRFIPGLRGNYAFNVASLFGWASVMMTYFGVNYYLSGLHSYAAGDPVPVPSFVYYTFISLVLICLAAFWKNRRLNKMKVTQG